MSHYTNAPACRILAIRCCACNTPLLDSVSAQLGIGPDCRKRLMGKGQGHSEEARIEANQIVYALALAMGGQAVPAEYDTDACRAACAIGGPRAVTAMLLADRAEGKLLDRLRVLGFEKLADKFEEKWMPIRITELNHAGDGRPDVWSNPSPGEPTIRLAAPYNEEAVSAQRGIPGRRWDKVTKCNYFPISQKAAVWRMLCKFYPGVAGIGTKGPFVVPADGVSPATSHAGWLEAARGTGPGNLAPEERELAAMDAQADRAGTLRDETAKAIARGLLTM